MQGNVIIGLKLFIGFITCISCHICHGQLPGMETALVNCEAIRNFDVSIDYWEASVPLHTAATGLESEFSEKSRLIVDYDKELLVYFRKELTVTSELITNKQTNGKEQNSLERRTYHAFVDGKNASNLTSPNVDAQCKFTEYLFHMQIPRIEFLGINEYPSVQHVSAPDFGDFLRGQLLKAQNPESRSLADGGRRETWMNGKTTIVRMFQREYYLPTSLWIGEVSSSGEKVPYLEITASLENANDVCRPVQINTTRRVKMLDVNGRQHDAETISTLKLKWNQFNSNDLEVPPYKDLLKDDQQIAKFIGM